MGFSVQCKFCYNNFPNGKIRGAFGEIVACDRCTKTDPKWVRIRKDAEERAKKRRDDAEFEKFIENFNK